MNRPGQIKFSIIIVSWNTKKLTEKCLNSVFAMNKTDNFQVIVIDNASSDGSGEMIKEGFPFVELIQNRENLGFSKANNQAIRIAQGEIILLLNSDAELLTENSLDELEALFALHSDYGILGAVQLFPNGKIQSIGRTFLSLKEVVYQQFYFPTLVITYNQKTKLRHRLLTADYVDGAFLAIRKSVIDEIGLMLESYFMYGEDMEWCARATQFGWNVGVATQIKILHHRGASSKQNFKRSLIENAQNVAHFICGYENVTAAKRAYDVLLLGMMFRIPLSKLRRNNLAQDYREAFLEGIQQRHIVRQKLETGS